MLFEAPSNFRKGWVISIQKFHSNSSYFSIKQKTNKYFTKKIRKLVKMNWWFDVRNKIHMFENKTLYVIVPISVNI